VTKAAANDCGIAVKINEIESSGGSPGDWVELYNPSPNPADISGFVFKDSDDAHSYVIPAATSIAGNAYFLLEEAAFGFGLGNPDSARLFAADGMTPIDSYAWTAHATTTYGRCPNGTGDFTTTSAPTKGAANVCPGDVIADPWPGDAAVQTADGNGALGGNMSGLAYQASGSTAPGVLWAVKNGPGTLFRLLWNGTIWTPDTANDWGAGKALHYPDGTGDTDSEGVTFANSSSAGGIYVATERNNAASGVSRNAILRFDASAAGTSLSATHEWNLTANLPAVGPNLGLEAITWVPDSFLEAQGFLDESTGQAYDPSDYADHGDGLFFVGVEANGTIYAYALSHADGSFTRIATIASGFVGVMGLEFDRDRNEFWAVCDDGCGGRSVMLAIDPATGKFAVTHVFERPAAMPNLNNEGFAIAGEAECTGNRKPAFWADDSGTGGNAIRRGTLPCTDPDADDDGIADEVDVTFPPGTSQAANPNNETFSDQLLAGGATSGTIVERNGIVSIRELTNPAGVRILVGDASEATLQLAGKPATIDLKTGTFEVTDPGATTTVHVVEGEAQIGVTLKGTPIVISVGAGDSVTYTETTDGNGVLTGLTIDEQTGGVSVSAGGLPADACGDIEIENVIIGTNGNETINGTPNNDLILAKNGNDTVNGNGGDDCIDAGEGNDKVTTLDGSDVIYAGGGNNTVNSGGGNNAVSSGNGNDEITTGTGDDVINAGGGNNKVQAGAGTNSVTTANGNDEVTTSSGNDTIDAGGGNNKVNAGDGTNSVTTGNGNDEVTTGAGDDTISAGGGNNKVNAGGGMDNVTTANGNDNVDCGDGVDTAHVGGGNNSNAGGRCETFAP
jgi:Ca2+-binding RTX toxin-like protein